MILPLPKGEGRGERKESLRIPALPITNIGEPNFFTYSMHE